MGVSDAREFVDNAGDTSNIEETENKETNGEALTEENVTVKADSKDVVDEDKAETWVDPNIPEETKAQAVSYTHLRAHET